MIQGTNRYDDIIHLPHPTSEKHPRMSRLERAAQFSPFAALTGHEEAVLETARLTDQRMELDEDMKAFLDEKLKIANSHSQEVTITYFVPDERKSGGAYVSYKGVIRKIDEYERLVLMGEDIKIPMEDIVEIQIS